LGRRNLLITFHPATLEPLASATQMGELLAALEELDDTHLIFTMPNADTEGRGLQEMVKAFVAGRSNARAYVSLGQLRYLSAVTHVDAVVGNSSSGLTEVPSFRKATVNIGDRQRGRMTATSVIDCEPDRASIKAAIDRAYSEGFQQTLRDVRNPYGDGGACERIVRQLERTSLEGLLSKSFYDLKPCGDD
jgi:GDP/UDP-N,N'-diacetylbacillosamine 2-epimerase (hydrolysing)